MYTELYLDDTGTPSQKSKSKYDTGDWTSWLAVILKPTEKEQLLSEIMVLAEKYKKEIGLREFHFNQIFSGKGKISLEKREEIFLAFAQIYNWKKHPVIIQSLTSDDIIRNRMEDLRHLKVDGFNFSKNSDLALWFLLKRSKDFLLKDKYSLPVKIFVDAGRQKPNTVQKIGILKGITEHSEIKYLSSHDEPLIQFIDFIAFSVNRMRWILMNEKKNDQDIRWLQIFSMANFDIINLSKPTNYTPDNLKKVFTVGTYDQNLRQVYDKNNNRSDFEVDLFKKSIGKK